MFHYILLGERINFKDFELPSCQKIIKEVQEDSYRGLCCKIIFDMIVVSFINRNN